MKERIKRILAHRERKTIPNKGLERAAVLIPIYERGGEYYLVFTRRTEKVIYHKGQISFPGGAHNEGETLETTALRESWEEIGLEPKDAEILGGLDEAVTTTSNYVISPFVAFIPYPYKFTKNPEEVEEIIEVPVTALLDKNSFREEVELRHGKPTPAYFYQYHGYIIWGATARILKQFLELVFVPF